MFSPDSPILVLSPHADDAVFSAHTLIEQPQATVWTVFAGEPEPGITTAWDTANGYPDGASLMRTRRAEDEAALEGLEHRSWPFLERAYTTPAQRDLDLRELEAAIDDWLDEHPGGRLSAPVGSGVHVGQAWYQRARERVARLRPGRDEHPPVDAPAATVRSEGPARPETQDRRTARARLAALKSVAADQVRHALHADAQRRRRQASRAGMLANEDHLAVHDLALRIAERRGVDLVLYEEFPYAWSEHGLRQVRTTAAGLARPAHLHPQRADAERKFARMSAYASQLRTMDPIERRLEDPATIPLDERYWLLPAGPASRSETPLEVSVIIPTFNRRDELLMQLEALATQVDAPPFEVLVVDNGSSHDVAETVEPLRGRLHLRVLDASAHRGPSYARNVGAGAAAAAKLAFCDDDDVVASGWVRAASRALDEAPFVTGTGVEFPADAFTSVAAIRQRLADALANNDGEKLHPTPVTGDYPILPGGTCAIRRDTFARLGGFDLRFAPGAEDKELSRRYLESGGELMTAPGMGLAVRLRPSARGSLKRTFRYAHRYVLLCEVHDLMRTSPVLNRPDFRVDFLRALVALSLSPLRHGAQRAEILDRLALRSGLMMGWVQYRLLKRIPPPRLAEGLSITVDAHTN